MSRLTRSYGIDTRCILTRRLGIAFVSEQAGGNKSCHGCRRQQSEAHYFEGKINADPWSPTENHCLCQSGATFDVFTVRTDGSGLTQITQGMAA